MMMMTTNNDPSSPATRLPVDRQWLRKLVNKYSRHEDDGDDSLSSSSASPIFIVAPMVDQSDLPFRLQCRKYGCQVAFTPMIHSRLLIESAEYRKKFLPRPIEAWRPLRGTNSSVQLGANDDNDDDDDATIIVDRPLIAQLCGSGHTPHFVLQAAQMLQETGLVDGIDLNCGCPQGIAKRGKYGAFLLEEPDALIKLVQLLTANLQIPVSVKVRLLPVMKSKLASTTLPDVLDDDDDDDDHSDSDYPVANDPALATDSDAPQADLDASLNLYRRLIYDAGIHMLTVHGRTRHHKGHHVGPCDLAAIQRVVQEFGHVIPIVANGSIASRLDALECLRTTKCDAIMSSEGILEYPALFESLTIEASAPEAQVDNVVLSLDEATNAPRRSRLGLAREYLELCELYPPNVGGQGSGIKCMRMHLHRILHADLQVHWTVRDDLCRAKSLKELHSTLDALEAIHEQQNHVVATEGLSWYYRHQKSITVGDGHVNDENKSINILLHQRDKESAIQKMEVADDTADCFACLFDASGVDEYDY